MTDMEKYKQVVFNRLQGRDIQKAVDELIYKVEDVIMDEIGMPKGWNSQDEDQQMAVLDIISEQMIRAYFTPKTNGEMK